MRWIMGYIECQVPGGHLERFMNLCRHHEIELWKVKEREKQAVFFYVRGGIFEIAPTCPKKTKTVPHIRKKCGFPFWCLKARRIGPLRGESVFFRGFVHPFPFCMGHSIPRTADLYQRRIGGGD